MGTSLGSDNDEGPITLVAVPIDTVFRVKPKNHAFDLRKD
jgi:hypothetical protein